LFQTRITKLLGIKYPVILGAMVWLGRAELAAAVSNAGGLGMVTAGSFTSAEELRQEIRKTRELTDKPFAVNVTLMPTRRPLPLEEFIAASIEEGVRIIETSGRSPEPYAEWLREAGVIHLHKAARLRDLKTGARLGAKAVTIVGFEGGGHPGMEDVTSLVRIPLAVDAVKVPVIAAGGFGDGRGLVAALALGAEAVTMATRFMLCKECPMHPGIKEMLRKTRETDTMIVERSINNAARVVKNGLAEEVLAMEAKGAAIEQLYPLLRGSRVRERYASGESGDALFHCGQVVGLAKDIPGAAEIIERTMKEAEQTGERLRGMGLPL